MEPAFGIRYSQILTVAGNDSSFLTDGSRRCLPSVASTFIQLPPAFSLDRLYPSFLPLSESPPSHP